MGNETSPVRYVLDDVSDDATDETDVTDDAREFYPLIFLRSARARAIAGSSTDDVKRRTTARPLVDGPGRPNDGGASLG